MASNPLGLPTLQLDVIFYDDEEQLAALRYNREKFGWKLYPQKWFKRTVSDSTNAAIFWRFA